MRRNDVRIHTLVIAVLVVLCVLPAANSARAEWPERTIRLLTPSAAGGSADFVARVLADKLKVSVKQPVVVENKASAGGVLSGVEIKNAAPDGHTFLLSSATVEVANPLLIKDLPYDPTKDFASFSIIGLIPPVLLVANDSPFTTLPQLVDHAKTHPNALSYGYASAGSRVNPLVLASRAGGIDWVEIPYTGNPALITDILAKRLAFTFMDSGSAWPFVSARQVRVLAVTTDQRSEVFPNVPAVAEYYPGFVDSSWLGVAAPARTPQVILEQMKKGIDAALASPDTTRQLIGRGITPIKGALSFDAVRQFVANDRVRWAEALKTSNIKPQ